MTQRQIQVHLGLRNSLGRGIETFEERRRVKYIIEDFSIQFCRALRLAINANKERRQRFLLPHHLSERLAVQGLAVQEIF